MLWQKAKELNVTCFDGLIEYAGIFLLTLAATGVAEVRGDGHAVAETSLRQLLPAQGTATLCAVCSSYLYSRGDSAEQ